MSVPLSPSKALAITLLSIAALGGCARDPRGGLASGPPASSQASSGAATASDRHRLLDVHATLESDLATRDDAPPLTQRLEAIARAHGGYLASSTSRADDARITLRIPADAIDEVAATLHRAGAMRADSRSAIDVTDAIEDVDARVHAATVEEGRLLRIVDERTGGLADVLSVERALADVRDRIERLEAEQRAAHGRVDLATVEIVLHLPPVSLIPEHPLGALRAAAGDGVAATRTALFVTALAALRAGPMLLVVCLAAALARVALRRMKSRAS